MSVSVCVITKEKGGREERRKKREGKEEDRERRRRRRRSSCHKEVENSLTSLSEKKTWNYISNTSRSIRK